MPYCETEAETEMYRGPQPRPHTQEGATLFDRIIKPSSSYQQLLSVCVLFMYMCLIISKAKQSVKIAIFCSAFLKNLLLRFCPDYKKSRAADKGDMFYGVLKQVLNINFIYL